MDELTPNPGTIEAEKAGCICPILDNSHGWGYVGIGGGEGIFIYTVGCPVHVFEDIIETEEEGG